METRVSLILDYEISKNNKEQFDIKCSLHRIEWMSVNACLYMHAYVQDLRDLLLTAISDALKLYGNIN